MTLVTTYQDSAAITIKQAEEAIVKAAQEKAIKIAVDYNLESVRFNNDTPFFLVSARRTKGKGMNVTYRSEASILRHAREEGLI